MQLWLTPRTQPNTRIHPPAVCPRPGCGGRRFQLHQVVAKGVRAVPAAARPSPCRVAVHRYTCRRCRRTFRMYPAGVDRGGVSAGVQRLAAALHLLGLSFRDVSRALAVLGVALGKSQAQALVAPRLRGLARRGVAPLLRRVEIGAAGSGPPAAWVWVHGQRLALRRAIDRRGRAALVVDDVDRETYRAVERWVRGTLTGFAIDVVVVFPAAGARRRRAMLWGLEAGQDEAAGMRDADGGAVGVGQDEAVGRVDADGDAAGAGPPAGGIVVAAAVGAVAGRPTLRHRHRRAGGDAGRHSPATRPRHRRHRWVIRRGVRRRPCDGPAAPARRRAEPIAVALGSIAATRAGRAPVRGWDESRRGGGAGTDAQSVDTPGTDGRTMVGKRDLVSGGLPGADGSRWPR